MIICVLLLNASYTICYIFVLSTSYISILIRQVGEQLFNTNICFSTFIEKINELFPITNNDYNLFSYDGLIRSLISIGFINLTISYALRFIMIKVFTLICPFAILCASIEKFNWIFKSWIKIYLSLLFLQIFVSFILVVSFSLSAYDPGPFSSLLYLGSVYALIKANSFMKEFFGGLSTDVSFGISSLKSVFMNN